MAGSFYADRSEQTTCGKMTLDEGMTEMKTFTMFSKNKNHGLDLTANQRVRIESANGFERLAAAADGDHRVVAVSKIGGSKNSYEVAVEPVAAK